MRIRTVAEPARAPPARSAVPCRGRTSSAAARDLTQTSAPTTLIPAQITGSSSTCVTSSATFDRSERCRVTCANRSFSFSASTTEAMPS